MKNLNKVMIAGCVCMALSSLPAMAGTSGGQIILNEHGERTLVVSYSDLNLASEAGVQALQMRMAYAAKRVCGNNRGTKELRARVEARTCVNRLEAEFEERLASLREQQGDFVAAH